MEQPTDAELVALARGGTPAAFDHLVHRYLPMARRTAAGMVADDDVASDLVQEALLQAYLSLAHLRDGARFPAWLRGIVRNVCRGYLRDRKSEWLSLEALTGGLQLDIRADTRDPQRIAEGREQWGAARAALAALAPRDRAVASLFFVEQHSLREIAAATGLTVAAVKNRLYRVRQALRERLADAYPELVGNGARKEKPIVVKVAISEVYEEERLPGRGATVVLSDERGRRLRIGMGQAEAAAINAGSRPVVAPRPMTYAFMAGLLDAAGARLEEVRIQSLDQGVFYAVAKLRRGRSTHELDARPSDALALAAHTGSPIYVTEAIMGAAGVDLPEAATNAEIDPVPLPETLPILPLRDKVYFPHLLFPLFIGREKSLRALEETRANHHFILVLAQKEPGRDDPRPDDLYQTGVVAHITQYLNLPDGTVRIMTEGQAKARVTEYLRDEPFHQARIELLADEPDPREGAEALMEVALARYHNLAVEKKTLGYAPVIPSNAGHGPGHLAEAMAPFVPLAIEEQQAILETRDPRERLSKLLVHLELLDASHTRP